MFYPHRANIQIKREEPANLNIKSASEFVRLRNSALAERVIQKQILKPKTITKKIEKRLKDGWESQARREDLSAFMVVWNRWRKFYFDLPPIQPKTKAQFTQIENVLEMVKKDRIDLHLLIACTHKAFVWRKVNPNFGEVSYAGKEHLARFMDEVLLDIDRAAYAESALR